MDEKFSFIEIWLLVSWFGFIFYIQVKIISKYYNKMQTNKKNQCNHNRFAKRVREGIKKKKMREKKNRWQNVFSLTINSRAFGWYDWRECMCCSPFSSMCEQWTLNTLSICLVSFLKMICLFYILAWLIILCDTKIAICQHRCAFNTWLPNGFFCLLFLCM